MSSDNSTYSEAVPKSIDGNWVKFLRDVVSKRNPEMPLTERHLKSTFYAGAASCLAVMRAVAAEDSSDEQGAAVFHRLETELLDHTLNELQEALIAKLIAAKPKGNG